MDTIDKVLLSLQTMTLSIEKNTEEVASIFHALKTVPPDATKFKQKLAVEFN